MSKFTKAIAAIMLTMAVVCAAGCNKNKENQGVAQFTATIEQSEGRTLLNPDNGQINWTAGDQIVISNADNETAIFNLQSGDGTTEGGFGTSDEFNTVGPFIAAYPSTAEIEADKVTFNLPATQSIGETGIFGNGANPMVAYSDDKNLQFKNLCGGLGIRLKGLGAHVTAVRITSKNTSEKLWGAYEVSDCASNEPTLTVASGNQGTNVITLNCNVTLTTAAKTFFVMLPPGTLANGFTMEVLDGNEVLATKETDSDVALVERNTMKVFNEILIDVEFDGNVEIPTGMDPSNIIVTNFGEDAMPNENGDFFIGYSKMLTAKNATNNEIIYMSVLSVDYDIAKGENQLQSYDLNAKETALYYALTMIPFGLYQTKDATFQSIKNVLYGLDCVQALENAIEQSVNQNGYLRAEDIGDELNAVWNYLEAELLAPFLDRQSANPEANAGHIVLKKDGTLRFEQPQIQNNGRYRGIRLDIESASFNEHSNKWTLNLTGYSDNGVFIGMNKGSIVNGQAYPTGGRTPYFIPPMNVGKFMGTFTSFSGLKDYFVDTWRLITEDDFWFDDMTWDMAKLQNISFELASNENALLMYSPKDDQPTAVVNGVYAIMQVVGMGLDAILTHRGYSEFFTSLFANQELCAIIAGLASHPENFTMAANALLDWAADLFATGAFQQFINPRYNLDKILDKIVSSSARAAVTYVGNSLGTLASWYLFDSFAFTVEAEYNGGGGQIPTDGLVAYYPFNGNANDESGNGHNGEIIGNVTLSEDRKGDANGAYRFYGEPYNYISISDDEDFHLSTFTLNAWVFSDAENYGSGHLINKGRDIINGSYRLQVNGVNAQNEYSGENGAWAENNPAVHEWHMITGTVQGDQAKIYIDGVLMGERTLSHPFVYSNSEPLTLGMHYYGGVPSYWAYPLLGDLDDVRIYNRVLTPSEIQALYNE